jgi:uncharacterized protein
MLMTKTASPGRIRWFKRLLTAQSVRIVGLMFGISLGMGLSMEFAISLVGKRHPFRAPEMVALVACLALYWLYVRFAEKRPVAELDGRKALPHLAAGLAIGFLMVSAVVGMSYAAGAYRVTGINAWQAGMLAPLVQMMFVGVFEEVLFRGVLFRMSEKSLGSWLALLLSCAVFGAGHLAGDGANVLAMLIVMLAGAFFVALFMVTRSLWLCIGIHAAWNYTLGTIYSVAVSGHERTEGWLAANLSGPDWLTGGAFGLEGSVLTLALLGVLTALLLHKAAAMGRIVPRQKRLRTAEQ